MIGSSVNLLASEVSEWMGYGAFGLFSFSAIGFGVWLTGGLVMLLLAERLLPNHGLNDDDLAADLASIGYLTEVEIPERSELIDQSLHASQLQRRFDVDVLELHRGNERILPPLADHTLALGDRLLLRLQQEHSVVLAPSADPHDPQLTNDGANRQRMVEVLLPAVSALSGDYLRDLRFRQRTNATVLALEKTGLASALARALMQALAGWPVYAALNAATVALLISIAGQLAVGLGQPPLAFIYAVVFGPSQSFLSPVGYQSNLMVFGPGRYRFLDITRYGLPLTLTMTVVVPLLICRHFNL